MSSSTFQISFSRTLDFPFIVMRRLGIRDAASGPRSPFKAVFEFLPSRGEAGFLTGFLPSRQPFSAVRTNIP